MPYGICQRSGFKYPLEELVKEWTGLLVHRNRVDQRHPQEFIRGVKDDQTVRNPSPEAEDTFLGLNDVTPGSL